MMRDAPTETVISLAAVSKRFRLFKSTAHRIRHLLLGGKSHADHWALTDIDLNIRRGESVALLGMNGAGKSTLLSIIAGTTGATAGTVLSEGRVSALLELGAGFHPNWTGRQNAEFYVRLMGLSGKQAKEALREIEEFADIGVYYEQPLRTYSTGMFLRVAFSAAVCVQPDVLIIDEVLAVGDARFQHKCFRRIAEFRERGVTILFVTHRLDQIAQICSRGIVLHKGKIAFDGDPDEAVGRYVEILFSSDATTAVAQKTEGDIPGYQIGTGEAEITDIILTGSFGTDAPSFATGEIAIFDMAVRFNRDVARPVIGFALKNVEGICIYGTNSVLTPYNAKSARDNDTVSFRIECPLRLAAGTYFADFSVCTEEAGEIKILGARMSAVELAVTGVGRFFGIADLNARIVGGPG
jgi:lipopolysaccharide transport system ATP-binding protein